MKKNYGVYGITCLLYSLLSGCGGGGDNGTNSALPSLRVSPSPITVTVSTNATLALATGRLPDTTATVTLVNVPSSAQGYGQYSTTGIDQVVWNQTSDTTAILDITFYPPNTLAPGTYSDNIYLKMCSDSNCTQTIAGTETTVPVTYVVTAPAVGAEPHVSASPNQLSVQALTNDYLGPGKSTIDLALTNFGYRPYVEVSNTTNGISIVNVNTSNASSASLDVYFKAAPSTPTVLTDVISVTVCLDANCVNPVSGSPFQIPVTYSVSDVITVAGVNGYSLRGVNLFSNQNLVWDNTRGKIYVSQQLTSTPGRGQILILNPQTGATEGGVLLDSMPNGALAISASDQYLYVGLSNGTVERLTLPNLVVDATVNVGLDSINNQRYAAGLAAMPGAPKTFAVAMGGDPYGNTGGYEKGVAIFDDSTPRPNAVEGITPQLIAAPVDCVVWNSTGSQLLGSSFSFNAAQKIYSMSVDSSGILNVNASSTSAPGGRPSLAGSQLYTDGGTIVDTTTLSLTSFVPFANMYGLLPAPDADKLFAAGTNGLAATISSYKLTGRSPITSLSVPSFINGIGSLHRIGASGLAYRTDNYVVLINGAFAAP